MPKQLLILLAIGMLTLISLPAFAADNASISITTAVTAINEISIADSSISMLVDQAVAGMNPAPIKRGTYYNATTNEAGKKISAAFGDDWITTAGVTFIVDPGANVLGAATGAAITFDNVATTDVAQDLCTASSVAGAYPEQQLLFTFTATAASGLLASAAHTLTLTIL